MAEAHAAKWKTMKNKLFMRLPPDADSLRQHCLRTNYLAYLVRHPSMKQHPSPLGHGWELVGGCCRPVRHRRPALPMNLPTPGPAEQGEDYKKTRMMVYRRAGRIHRNLVLQTLMRQNGLIRTDWSRYMWQCLMWFLNENDKKYYFHGEMISSHWHVYLLYGVSFVENDSSQKEVLRFKEIICHAFRCIH